MLTMRLAANTMKTVAFYHTLEPFTFCIAYYFNIIAFSENVNGNGFTDVFLYGIIAKFFCNFFGSCLSFCKMIYLRFSGVLFFFIAERKRKCIVPVGFGC